MKTVRATRWRSLPIQRVCRQYYKSLEDAFIRLRGCTIATNIRTGDTVQTDVFGLIERGGFRRKYGTNGRLQHVEITLFEWL